MKIIFIIDITQESYFHWGLDNFAHTSTPQFYWSSSRLSRSRSTPGQYSFTTNWVKIKYEYKEVHLHPGVDDDREERDAEDVEQVQEFQQPHF